MRCMRCIYCNKDAKKTEKNFIFYIINKYNSLKNIYFLIEYQVLYILSRKKNFSLDLKIKKYCTLFRSEIFCLFLYHTSMKNLIEEYM